MQKTNLAVGEIEARTTGQSDLVSADTLVTSPRTLFTLII